MAYDPKMVVVFGAAGLLLSALLITAFQFMPALVFPDVPVVAAKGLLIIKVKDAPAKLEELWIQIDEVRAHRVIEDADGEPPWMNVDVVLEDSFDLLLLEDFAIVLATQQLPAGEYTEIRLHVLSAYANISDQEELEELTVVSNGWLKVKVHFTLLEEGVTTIVADIQVNETPIIRSKHLHPVVKATVEAEDIGASMPVQTNYRWAENDSAESPSWKAGLNESITDVAVTEEVLRLRLAINNTGKAIWSSAQLKLQYTNDTAGDWDDVDAKDGTGIWRYCEGLGSDKTVVTKLLLDGSTIAEHFVESSPTETIIMVPVDDQGEWDVCIESNGADPDETYYFRFVLSDGTPLYDHRG